MSKITINDITSQFASAQAINSRFQQIETALNDKVLWRDNPVGEANELNQDLDLNGFQILNLPAPVNPTDPVRLQDMEEAIQMPDMSISDLNDVDPNLAPTTNQVLAWNATTGQFEAVTLADGVTPLSVEDLTDVTISGITDGQILKWVAANGRFEPADDTGGASSKTPLTSAVTVTVGPTGDYATIIEAIQAGLDTYEPASVTSSPVTTDKEYKYTISLQSGYVWEDTIKLFNVDASWMEIVASTTINSDNTLLDGIDGVASSKVALYLNNAKSPVIDITLSGNSVSAANTYMFYLRNGSVLNLGDNLSFTGFEQIINSVDSSVVQNQGLTTLSFQGYGPTVYLNNSKMSLLGDVTMNTSAVNAGDVFEAINSDIKMGSLSIGGSGTGVLLDAEGSNIHIVTDLLTVGVPTRNFTLSSTNLRVEGDIATQCGAYDPRGWELDHGSHVQCDGGSIEKTGGINEGLYLLAGSKFVSKTSFTVDGNGTRVRGSEVIVGGFFLSYVTYPGTSGPGDLDVDGGGIVRIGGGVGPSNISIPTNTLTADGIVFL